MLSGWRAGGSFTRPGAGLWRSGGSGWPLPAGTGIAACRAHQPDWQPLPPQAVRGGRPRREAGAGQRHLRIHLSRPADELPRQRRHTPQSAAQTPAGRIL